MIIYFNSLRVHDEKSFILKPHLHPERTCKNKHIKHELILTLCLLAIYFQLFLHKPCENIKQYGVLIIKKVVLRNLIYAKENPKKTGQTKIPWNPHATTTLILNIKPLNRILTTRSNPNRLPIGTLSWNCTNLTMVVFDYSHST